MQWFRNIQQHWKQTSIALKLRLALSMMVLVVLLIASSGYILLDTVRKKTESTILSSVQIQQIVLQMDGRLEKARRCQRDFFLRYPQTGFDEARDLYVIPALDQIEEAAGLSQQLRALIAGSTLGNELEQRNIDFNLYLSMADRYAGTLREAVDLVFLLANEQNGLQQQLTYQSQALQQAIRETNRREWIDMGYEIQRHEYNYLISRRRAVMQSAFNQSTMLQVAIQASDTTSQAQKDELLRLLKAYDDIAQQVVALDSAVRSKLNDFELQAQSVDPISTELLQLADSHVLRARAEINRTAQLANLLLALTGLAGIGMMTLITDILNRTMVQNIFKLTKAARALEAGNLQAMVRIDSEDELGNLAHAFNSMTRRLEVLITSLQASERRYRSLFEDSPIALWEEDFSDVRPALEELRAAGVSDWHAYFLNDPGEIKRLMRLGRVIDLNRAAMNLLKCEIKEALLGSMEKLVDDRTQRAFAENLVALANRCQVSDTETFLKDFEGNIRFIHIRASVVIGYEDSFAKILVSMNDITEREQREQEMSSIAMVSAALRTAKSRAEMLPVILDQLTHLLKTGSVALAVHDPGTGETRVELARGELNELLAGDQLPFNSVQEPVHHAHLLTNESAYQGMPRAVIYAPLIAQGSAIGTLWVSRNNALRPPEMRILNAIADIAANAIHRATLFEATLESADALARAYEATIEGWSRALDLRDRETEGHTQRVTTLTLRLARTMNVPEQDLVHFRRGALLHDIGKMGVPDEILRKPGPLNDQEWRIMRMHPDLALGLISPIAYLHHAIDIPYCHHEKWDGSGYPRGLKGEEIPLAARIFSIVDVWDALLSDRPYRKPWPRAQVIRHLHEQSGSHFDPRVVEVFIQMQEREKPGEIL